MTPTQQQQRRRELYKLSQNELVKIYAKLSGHLVSEIRRDVLSMTNPMGYLVDVIVYAESRQ